MTNHHCVSSFAELHLSQEGHYIQYVVDGSLYADFVSIPVTVSQDSSGMV